MAVSGRISGAARSLERPGLERKSLGVQCFYEGFIRLVSRVVFSRRGLPSQVKGAGLRTLSRRGSWVQIPPPAPDTQRFTLERAGSHRMVTSPLRRLQAITYWVIEHPEGIHDFINTNIRKEWSGKPMMRVLVDAREKILGCRVYRTKPGGWTSWR